MYLHVHHFPREHLNYLNYTLLLCHYVISLNLVLIGKYGCFGYHLYKQNKAQGDYT